MSAWMIVIIPILVVSILTLGGLLAGAAYFRAVVSGRTEGEVLARQGLTEVADALTRYKADSGVYPRELKHLVPRFLSRIPEAKPGAPITYLYSEHDPMLLYSAFIFYRRILHVITGRWSALD